MAIFTFLGLLLPAFIGSWSGVTITRSAFRRALLKNDISKGIEHKNFQEIMIDRLSADTLPGSLEGNNVSWSDGGKWTLVKW